LLFQRG